jgi:flagellar hook-associated protein 2
MVTSVSSSTPNTVTTGTSTSSSKSTANTGNAAAKAAAQSLITSLGSGSGVDVNSLASNLVQAERAPQQAAIQSKIDKSNATISGYSAIKYVLGNLQTAFADLKDKSDFSSIVPNNSQPASFSVSADATTTTGSHTVLVRSLAKPQRTLSSGFVSAQAPVSPDKSAFSLTVNVNGNSSNIDIKQGATAQDMVDAINKSSSGVKAQLINTGSGAKPFRIMLTGPTGQANNFTVSSTLTPTPPETEFFAWSNLQTAADADLQVDGLDISSTSNQVKGAIAGVTLTLQSPTTGTDGASLDLARDTSSVKTKVQSLVSAYNDTLSMLGVVSDPKSSVATYGATLVGNSIVNTVRSQVRDMVVGFSNTPSGGMKALRDIGVTVDKSGQLQIDSTKLDNALQTNFDDVVTMLSNNQQDQGQFDGTSAGIAGEANKKLTDLLNPTGTLTLQSNNQTSKISDYQKQLDALETRMQALLDRYTKQFAAMDSLVGSIKSTQAGLKSTFDGMMATYTNK